MAEAKERSAVFKFFYVILSIVTFPVFLLIFVLRHPLWMLFLLCLAAGGIVYYPMSLGIGMDKIPGWYKGKYTAIKFEMVAKAVDSGKTDFIPQVLIDEANQMKKALEEEKAEAVRPKGENFNEKISRDVKIEDRKVQLKKKGGFKKQGESNFDSEKESLSEQHIRVLEENAEQAGGLAAIVRAQNNMPVKAIGEADGETASVSGDGKADEGQGNEPAAPFLPAGNALEKEDGQSAETEFLNKATQETEPVLDSNAAVADEKGPGSAMPAFSDEDFDNLKLF